MAQEFSLIAANKHMTLAEIEVFCQRARLLGARGDEKVKVEVNWFTIKKLTVEYDPTPADEVQSTTDTQSPSSESTSSTHDDDPPTSVDHGWTSPGFF